MGGEGFSAAPASDTLRFFSGLFLAALNKTAVHDSYTHELD